MIWWGHEMTVSYVEDPSYASSKLGDSIVSYNGFPHQVLEVSSRGLTVIRDMIGNTNREVGLEDLDLTPFKLGYMNSGRMAHYLMRIPSRQWRQGLRTGLIYSYTGGGLGIFRDPMGFVNMVRGVYPSPGDVFDMLVNDEVDSYAFSRSFRLSKSTHKKPRFFLSWKGRQVGEATMGDRRLNIKLAKDYEYLSEMLEEERNGRA